MMFIKDLLQRPFSFGEGIRGMRPISEQNDEGSVAIGLIVAMPMITKKKIKYKTVLIE